MRWKGGAGDGISLFYFGYNLLVAALNENYQFVQVRYAISREAVTAGRRQYDVGGCFLGNPEKRLFPVGTRLFRLEAMPTEATVPRGVVDE